MLKQGDVYRDPEGRTFKLDVRTDPRGNVPPYWSVVHVNTGRRTTVREDRLLTDYSVVDGEQ